MVADIDPKSEPDGAEPGDLTRRGDVCSLIATCPEDAEQ
jgi:hypothetical protein